MLKIICHDFPAVYDTDPFFVVAAVHLDYKVCKNQNYERYEKVGVD